MDTLDEHARTAALQAAVRTSGSGIAVVGADRRIIVANDRLCRILGIAEDAAALTGRDAGVLGDAIGAARVLPRPAAVPDQPVEYELGDGACIAVSRTNGEDGLTIWHVEDITARRHAERDADRATRRITRIYESMTDAFFMLDREWRFVYMNPVTEAMRDGPPGELLGRNMWEEFPDLVGSAYHREYGRAMRENVPVRVVEPWRGRVYEAFAYPSEEGLSVYFRDLTTQVQAREALATSEERFRISFEAAPLGMAVIGLDARFVQVNAALCALLGYSEEELMRKDFPSIEHPDDIPASIRHYQAMLEGGSDTLEVEKRLLHADGHPVWVLATAALVRDAAGRPAQFVAQIQDITERRRAIDDLRASEQRLATAYDREREAAERLRALDEMKNAFLSAVSHDLRTPLTAIVGFAETLERTGDALDDRTRRTIEERLATNARRLSRLLTDLLDLDRLQRGILQPNRRRTDLATLVADVIRRAEFGDEHPIHLELEPLIASVDPAQVERIVENLVANAVRHTPAGTRIWVRLHDQGATVLLTVEDEGPGVAPSARAAIFEAFRQGPDAPSHSPGVGIGLSLVARFAALHGGMAWCEDRAGGGAAFSVQVPKDEPVRIASSA